MCTGNGKFKDPMCFCNEEEGKKKQYCYADHCKKRNKDGTLWW